MALTADENAFLAASLEKRSEREAAEAERQAHETRLEQRSRRFLQALVGVFAVAAVVAVVLSILAFNAQQSARSEADARATQQVIAEDEAQARAAAEAQAIEDRDRALEAEQEALKQASIGLASQALAEMQTVNSERGVLLALAALEEYPYTPQAEAALARAVQESLPYKFMIDDHGHGLDGHWVDFSPDGKRIALGAAENDQGEHAAVIFDIGKGEIDLVIPLKIAKKSGVQSNERCSAQQINWSPDGTRLALVVNNNNLETPQPHCYYFQVYNAETGELLLDLDSQGEFAVDWSPDGMQLLTGGENGRVKIWDANSGELVLEL
jgi:dipeptidyl aminopeptidase/acylaminoacyl peptidase